MKSPKRVFNSLAVLAVALVLAPAANAAYPSKMDVTVELWSGVAEPLSLTSASWIPPGTDLSSYVIPADHPTVSLALTLANPRNDSASFRLGSEGKECEFKLGHEAKFQWFSVNPAPEKSASARSVGQVAVGCSASVIKGTDSSSAYTVRFVMKHITR